MPAMCHAKRLPHVTTGLSMNAMSARTNNDNGRYQFG